MKKILITLLLFSFSILTAKPQIYICSRLTEPAKLWNNDITKILESDFRFFRPQDIDLSNTSPDHIDLVAFKLDFEGMSQSDLLLVLPPYGRDCAWELGWFCGNAKPTIAYVEVAGDWLRDAMVKGGLTAIITTNPDLYKILLEDPITCKKSSIISSRQDLGKAILDIYQNSTPAENATPGLWFFF